jgi:hypothetical protein
MYQSKRLGCHVYPLLFLIILAVPGLLAQNSPGSDSAAQAPASASPPAAASPQVQSEPENPQQNQIRLAQQAQARIHARREQRKQRVVQDTYSHKFEVYGGGGYTRFRPGGSLQHINEAAWNGGVTDYLWGRLGITADVRGYYGTAFITPNVYNIFKPSISQYTFMAGPQYRLVRREHWGIGAQVLVGASKGDFNANGAAFPGQLVGLWSSGTSLSVAAGVPIDYNLSPGLAFRIQPGYWLSTFGSTTQVKNLGFTTGIVYRFGRQ